MTDNNQTCCTTVLAIAGVRLGKNGYGGLSLIKHSILNNDIVRSHAYSKRMSELTSQGQAELYAAISALKHMTNLDHKSMTVRTSSQHVYKGLTEWMSNWEANGWRNAAGKPVADRDLWLILRELNNGLTIEWQWAATGVDMMVTAATSVAKDASRGLIKTPKDLQKLHPQLFIS